MPAKAPPRGTQLKKVLRQLGQEIRDRRKQLELSAVATSEAAFISRMTLNRIEKGEPSVTLGAYINVLSALGLELDLRDKNRIRDESLGELPKRIRVADYPQLKRLAWQLKDSTELSPEEALELYERNWRHVENDNLQKKERQLIDRLLAKLGRSKLLV